MAKAFVLNQRSIDVIIYGDAMPVPVEDAAIIAVDLLPCHGKSRKSLDPEKHTQSVLVHSERLTARFLRDCVLV